MSAKTIEIIKHLKSLTTLETTELVKQIEAVFGVDASPQVRFSPLELTPLEKIEPPEPEKTEFDVVLEGVPTDKKIAVLKVVRTITGLGLKESKNFVDSAPKTLSSGIAISEAEDIKQQLEAAGAKVLLK